MKKRKVASFVSLIILFSCSPPNPNGKISPNEVLSGYLAGEIVIPVGDAYDLYDQDTSGVVFLDLRDNDLFLNSHELGAVSFPASELLKVNRKALSTYKNQVLLLYSDEISQSINAWFVLKNRGVPDIKVVLGEFDPAAGMLIDISPDPRFDYMTEFEKAYERLQFEATQSPAIEVPKKVVVTRKKPVVEEEEEGC